MPEKQISVNLIGEEQMEHTPIGRIITWAVTYGRYIMIGTEIVVLLAFISRFSLDRKLTDLNDEISQKQSIIEANIAFETDFRNIQDQLTKIKTLVDTPPATLRALQTIQSLLPGDVYLTSLDVSQDKITADAVAGTTAGFSGLIGALQATNQFAQVDIGDIHQSPIHGIQFEFTARIVPTKL